MPGGAGVPRGGLVLKVDEETRVVDYIQFKIYNK